MRASQTIISILVAALPLAALADGNWTSEAYVGALPHAAGWKVVERDIVKIRFKKRYIGDLYRHDLFPNSFLLYAGADEEPFVYVWEKYNERMSLSERPIRDLLRRSGRVIAYNSTVTNEELFEYLAHCHRLIRSVGIDRLPSLDGGTVRIRACFHGSSVGFIVSPIEPGVQPAARSLEELLGSE